VLKFLFHQGLDVDVFLPTVAINFVRSLDLQQLTMMLIGL